MILQPSPLNKTMPYSDNSEQEFLWHVFKSGLDFSPGTKPHSDVYPNESSHNRALKMMREKFTRHTDS